MIVRAIPEEIVSKYHRPRCTADTSYNPEQLGVKVKQKQCKHNALFYVDGAELCKLHAGRVLLCYAVEKGEI